MAGDWIKMRSNIKDDPDVILMAGNLSMDEFAVIGRLHAVWAWLDQHSTTGTNVRITSAYLDRLTACSGFADAMRAVDWLRGRDGDLEFPNFDRHNGESAKLRAADTKRKQESRTNVRNEPDICPKKTGPEKRREEKSKEPPNPLPGEAPLALPFDSSEFAEAWANWIRHRKEIRHPLKASTIQSQLKMLAKWGQGKAIAAIEASINAGWQGLFEPKIDPTLKVQAINGGGLKWADVAPL